MKFGFVNLRPPREDETFEREIGDVCRKLRRESSFTDEAGYECEIFAAAISPTNRMAYIESRAKDVGPNRLGWDGREIDVAIRIHLVETDGSDRSVDIESYNPFFGCNVEFFEWLDDTVILIYNEKHWTYAYRFGDIWPPKYMKIERDWAMHHGQLAYVGYKDELVRRLSIRELDELNPISKSEAAELGFQLRKGSS
jgi:hypothetical protein